MLTLASFFPCESSMHFYLLLSFMIFYQYYVIALAFFYLLLSFMSFYQYHPIALAFFTNM